MKNHNDNIDNEMLIERMERILTATANALHGGYAPPDPCIVTMLRSPARLEPHTCNEAADEIERLRKERDEARREVCESDTDTHGGALLEAERRGWDCFKENNP